MVLRYADDLGYVPISSVRGMPCIIPQAGFEGSKSANFLGGDERHKTSLDFEAERLSHSHFDDQRHKTSTIDLCSSTPASANCELRTKQSGNKIASQITKQSVYTTSLLVLGLTTRSSQTWMLLRSPSSSSK